MLTVVLDNLRSKHNVGAIFRTADAVGVAQLILCGTTPQPVDRFGRPVNEIHKTALGAESIVPYSYVTSTLEAVRTLQNQNIPVLAVEQAAAARNIMTLESQDLPYPAAFVFGNEIDGVDKAVLAASDDVLMLPMQGKKESLNVSVAVGATLFLYHTKR